MYFGYRALLVSGVFAVAPYVRFLTTVAALNVDLSFIIDVAVFSVLAIVLSAIAIGKSDTISEKEAQLAEKDAKLAHKEKVIGAKNRVISNLSENDILKTQHRKKKQEGVLDCADLRNLFKEEEKNKEVLCGTALRNLFGENSRKDAKTPNPESQPTKEENGQSLILSGMMTGIKASVLYIVKELANGMNPF